MADDPADERDLAGAPTLTGRVVAVANQKGGVGKTTTAVNLGAALAESDRAVVVVDLDPQGNASTSLGIGHAQRAHSVYDVITGRRSATEALVETGIAGLRLLPSTVDLAGAEIELVGQFARESLLKQALQPVRLEADLVLVDCPPSLGLLTVNALTAADEVIVPIQCEYFALEGLGQLLRNLRLIQQNVNPNLRLNGIVLTMYDPRTKLSEQVAAEVRSYFGAHVYRAVVPRSVRASEAPGFGMPVVTYDPSSRAATAYRELGREFLERPAEGGHPIAFPTDPLGAAVIEGGPPRVVEVAAPTRDAGPAESAVSDARTTDDAVASAEGPAEAAGPGEGRTVADPEAVGARPEARETREEPIHDVMDDMPPSVPRRARWPFRKVKGEDP